jgi:CheY-like chemotaxis protein
MQDVAKLLESVAKILSSLVWPGLIVFVIVRYGSSIRTFLDTLSELSFKGAGFEASLQRRQAEATTALVAAAAARPDEGATPEIVAKDVAAAKIAVEAVTPRALRRASQAKVLWVDDRPSNNTNERRALEALGVDVTISTSTDDALAKIERQNFDVIISDMGRPSDARAGYTLLDKIRAAGNTTPYVIYAGSRAPENVAEARRRGAMGCTNRPDELFDYVLTAIGRQ